MPVHLSPILEPARDVILVGDPRRAFALAQALTVQPKMSHLARGLWGYTGASAAGHELTVQATGVGGPSAVAVISDLAEMGAGRFIRLGTCVSVEAAGEGDTGVAGQAIQPGEGYLVDRAWAGDGASRALTGDQSPVLPDPVLTGRLMRIAESRSVFSHDLLPRLDRGRTVPGSAGLRDLQTAATFACAARLGASAAALLVVSEAQSGGRLDESQLEAIFEPLGRAVVEILEA